MPKPSVQRNEVEQEHIPAYISADPSPTSPHSEYEEEHGHDHAIEWIDVVRIAFVAVCAVAVWFRLPYFPLIGAAGIAVGVYPIAREALEDVLEKKMTMELSMT